MRILSQREGRNTSKKFKTPQKQLIFNGIRKENAGLYAYDLQRLATSGEMVTYRLKDAIVGVNRHIDFCDNS